MSIVDNDDPPGVTVDDETSDESVGVMTFTIQLDAVSGRNVSLDYVTSNQTAVAGNDYTSQTGSVIIVKGGLATAV